MSAEVFLQILNNNDFWLADFRNNLKAELEEKDIFFVKVFNLACIQIIESSDDMILNDEIFGRLFSNMTVLCKPK
jgi:hypothetical protein